MKKNIRLAVATALLALAVTSCKENYFDQQAYEDRIAQAFVTDNVDPEHTWRTVGTAQAQVTVWGDAGERYTVKVYDGNPLGSQPVTLYCTGEVESGSTFTADFSYALSRLSYYVAVFDRQARCQVQQAVLADGILRATLGQPQAPGPSNIRPLRASEADYSGSYAKTADDYLNPTTNIYGQATNLRRISEAEMKTYTAFTDEHIAVHGTLSDGNFPVGDHHHYRVAAGTVINSAFSFNATYGVVNDAVVYIEGTLHLKNNTLNGATLVVASGGHLVVDQNTSMSNAGRFVILPGGQLTGADGVAFSVNNGGSCYNAGTISYKGELNTNGSDFYNCGSITLDLLRNTSGGRFTNFGTITARTNMQASDAYNSTIINACYMHYTADAGIGTLTNLAGSRLQVDGTAEFNQGDQYLHAHSIVDAGAIHVNATRFYGPPSTSDYAVLKTGKVYWAGTMLVNQDNSNWQSVNIGNWTYVYMAMPLSGANRRGTIYVDWDNTQLFTAYNHSQSKYGDTEWKAINASGWTYVSEATAPATLTIPAGTCTGTGYNANGNQGGQQVKETTFQARYCFEDNFPMEGDYDFNDIVLTLSPRIKGDTVWLTVSLDAVGGLKQAAAALRVSGVQRPEVVSCQRTGNFDLSGVARPLGSASIIASQDDLLPDELNNTGNLVVNLFNDAHYVMGMQALAQGKGTWQEPNGNVRRWFYNTVKPGDPYEWYTNGVSPVSVTYRLIMSSEAAAARFTLNNLDPFIVESFNGAFWEVHTVPYKIQQVLKPYVKDLTQYSDNKPWAIQVAQTADFTFRYPIEWYAIGYYKNNELGGAYQTNGHSFGQWAADRTQAADWYLYPTEGKVY